MEASLGSFRKPNVYYYEGGRVHLIKMQRKPSGSYKSDQPPHSPIIRTNRMEAALLKFKAMSCHNSLVSNKKVILVILQTKHLQCIQDWVCSEPKHFQKDLRIKILQC